VSYVSHTIQITYIDGEISVQRNRNMSKESRQEVCRHAHRVWINSGYRLIDTGLCAPAAEDTENQDEYRFKAASGRGGVGGVLRYRS